MQRMRLRWARRGRVLPPGGMHSSHHTPACSPLPAPTWSEPRAGRLLLKAFGLALLLLLQANCRPLACCSIVGRSAGRCFQWPMRKRRDRCTTTNGGTRNSCARLWGPRRCGGGVAAGFRGGLSGRGFSARRFFALMRALVIMRAKGGGATPLPHAPDRAGLCRPARRGARSTPGTLRPRRRPDAGAPGQAAATFAGAAWPGVGGAGLALDTSSPLTSLLSLQHVLRCLSTRRCLRSWALPGMGERGARRSARAGG
jgi:hypothetical protein